MSLQAVICCASIQFVVNISWLKTEGNGVALLCVKRQSLSASHATGTLSCRTLAYLGKQISRAVSTHGFLTYAIPEKPRTLAYVRSGQRATKEGSTITTPTYQRSFHTCVSERRQGILS